MQCSCLRLESMHRGPRSDAWQTREIYPNTLASKGQCLAMIYTSTRTDLDAGWRKLIVFSLTLSKQLRIQCSASCPPCPRMHPHIKKMAAKFPWDLTLSIFKINGFTRYVQTLFSRVRLVLLAFNPFWRESPLKVNSLSRRTQKVKTRES